ncbi:MAG: hypothetical protein K0Q52_118 [Microbacterium sp.]|jgi:hypothetical protein|nr:hypothetical protein [Microbacterium sp.]
MANTEVSTTGNVAILAGPDTAIPSANWSSGPTFAQISALLNVSAGVKIDGTDFNVEASEQVDDRSFADQAGSQSRGPIQASGSIEVYTPGKGDTTSPHAKAYDAFGTPRTKLVVGQRFAKAQGGPVAAGDEVNLFRVQTDARAHNRNDSSRTLGVGLVFQDNALINYIVPAAAPTIPTVAVQGGVSLTTLTPTKVAMLKVTYHGRNITAGATYTSSNEAVFTVTKSGIIIAVGVGTATLKVSYPGAGTIVDQTITVVAA